MFSVASDVFPLFMMFQRGRLGQNSGTCNEAKIYLHGTVECSHFTYILFCRNSKSGRSGDHGNANTTAVEQNHRGYNRAE
jgi:hypothetical protein